jgi:hypothetical protein
VGEAAARGLTAPADTRRGQIELQQQGAGVAPSPTQTQDQLRQLNDLSRQLAPGVPPPAPQAQPR